MYRSVLGAMSLKARYDKGHLFRRVLFWAAIGFAALFALGPIMVVLFFAALGFATWILVQAAYFGTERTWQNTQLAGRKLAIAALAAAGSLLHLCRLIEQSARWAYEQGGYTAGRPWAKARQSMRFIGPLLLETPGGAVVVGKKIVVVALTAGSWSLLYPGKLIGHAARSAYEQGGYVVGLVSLKARQNMRFIGSLLLETLGGAGVGALLGYVINNGTEAFKPAVLTGAALGAFLGLLLGVSRYEPTAESTS
jgi:hypothetical protein